jgi:AhpD family alkylhydroperoxidase
VTTKRVYLDKQHPSVFAAMNATAAEIRARADDAGLSRATLELVNIRVSQINGCAYCLALHSRRALAGGETPQRLAVLPAWRETELFSEAERAALEIAEATTSIAGSGPGQHLPDDDYARLRQVLTDDQLSLLTWAAIAMNAFNRVSILSRHPVRPARPAREAAR